MPSVNEELLLPSMLRKFKDKSHAMHRQFYCYFASTSTMCSWALFFVALTMSYLSFQSFMDSGNRYFSTAWGGSTGKNRSKPLLRSTSRMGSLCSSLVPSVSSLSA
ncbi:UDP-glucuronate 4-epimerase 1-like [Forsythia ovata]|uniref:UDP-glucuronate 4-epimerase 1-like n=1 Tax=Forsythia ovata TaxID=205694 RepID=A0ABD1S7E6_9LAMI